MSLTVAILAGGLATRLQPLTEHVPKSLIDVAGEPFAIHQLRLLSGRGIRHVVYCVGHLGSQIRRVLGDAQCGVQLSYVDDGQVLLGTGGALHQARPLLGEAFLVLYGDSYLDCDYVSIGREFLESGKLGLMTVYENDGRWERSNVWLHDQRIVSYDKGASDASYRHVDYGLSAFRSEAFDGYEPGVAFDLSAVFQDLIARDQLAMHSIERRFFEIGSPAGIQDLSRHLEAQQR